MRKKRTRAVAGLMAASLIIMCVSPAVYAATTSDEEEIGPGYETVEETEPEPEIGPGYENGISTAVDAQSTTESESDNENSAVSVNEDTGTESSEIAAGTSQSAAVGISYNSGTTAENGTSSTVEKTSVTYNLTEISDTDTDESAERGDEEDEDGVEEGALSNESDEDIITDDENGGYFTISIGDFEITLGDDTEEVLKGIVDVNSYLNLRTGAGTGYEIIGHLFPGTEVEVTGEDGDWYEITVPEQTGYVCGDYLDLVETAVSNGTSDETVLLMMMLMMMQESMKEPEPEPEPEPVVHEVVTTGGLTPEGNLILVDDIGSSTEAGQQFITLVTKNGNYFYLIIDRDTDGGENVHFLNMVDERDLLDLMNEDEAAEYTSSATTVVEEAPVVITYEPAETEDTEEVTEETKKSSGVSFILVIVIVLVIVGGGVFFVFKKKQDAAKETKTKPDPDADYGVEDTADAEPDDAYEFPEEEDYEPDDEIPDETDYEDDYLEDDPEDNEENN